MDSIPLSERRLEKFKRIASYRQHDLTVILENVHDPHNIGAVLRTCDAVGISEVYVILTDSQIDSSKYKIGSKSASSAKKWLEIHIMHDVTSAFDIIRKKYKTILGTHLATESKSLYDLKLSSSVALMFGNEHDGISPEALSMLDGNFIIPQFGMCQSLNISVACAISLYEACRQRISKGMYKNENETKLNTFGQNQLEQFIATHKSAYLKNRNS